MTLRALFSLVLSCSFFHLSAQIHSLSYAVKVNFTSGTGISNPIGIAGADFDGDGRTDLAALNVSNAFISVYKNAGSGNSINGSLLAAPVTFTCATGASEIKTAGVDGDNKPDLIVCNNQISSVSIFLNTSISGTISFAAKTDFTSGNNPIYRH